MADWERVDLLFTKAGEMFDKAGETMSAAFEAMSGEFEAVERTIRSVKTTPGKDGRSLREHTIKMLPSGVIAKLILPQDLSEKEVEELCAIIRKIGGK